MQLLLLLTRRERPERGTPSLDQLPDPAGEFKA